MVRGRKVKKKDLRCAERIIREVELKMNKEEYINKQTSDEKIAFPIELIPEGGWIKDYIDFAYPLSEAPIQFHIGTSLILVGATCKRNVYLPFGAINIYPNLYILIIAKSGIARKSTALSPAFNILYKISPESIMGNITSLEAFYDSFSVNPHQIIIHGEFKTFIENCKRKYGQGLMTEVTNLWDCPPCLKVNLKNVSEEKRYISEPSLCLLGATTFDWLQLEEVDIEGGFFGRFLPIVAPTGRNNRYIAIPPEMDDTKLNQLVKRLQKISERKGRFTITPECKELIEGLYKESWQDYEKLPDKTRLLSHWSRVQTHMLKLAMIFKLSEEPSKLVIDNRTVLRAFEFMKKITEHYKYLLSKVAFTNYMRRENKAVEILREVGEKGVERSKFLRSLGGKAKQLDELINTLKEKELLVDEVIKTKTKPKIIYYAREYAPEIFKK